jgi:hypothetical protein
VALKMDQDCKVIWLNNSNIIAECLILTLDKLNSALDASL